MPSADQEVTQLLDEIGALDAAKDGELLLAKYAAAASLVDRKLKPLQWAALREAYGGVAFNMPARLEDALEAFRDSLPYWDRVAHHPQWAECKSYIGWTLFALGRRTPPESEEAIECLEATIGDYPDGTAEKLALYYSSRAIGDPLENWKKWVHYLEAALAAVSAQSEPATWARFRNQLANALTGEPSGDFAQAMETRILYHQQALAVLTPALRQSSAQAQAVWISVSIDTSEAYMRRVGGNHADNLIQAGAFARNALAACTAATPRDGRAFATLAVVRVLLNEDTAATAQLCAEALALCASVEALYGPGESAMIVATSRKFKALAYLRLVRLGDVEQIDGLVAAVEATYALLDPLVDASTCRVVARIAADGLLLTGDFARAVGFFRRSQDAGEASLQQAHSRAARLECIFDLHDASALLGYCLIATGDVPGGLEAIDRNKGRFWREERVPATFAEFKGLLPEKGALIFPSFGPGAACVVILAASGEHVCDLEGFGLDALRELLLKDLINPESDAWMSRYAFRHSRPEQWSARIDAIGPVLFEKFWSPVLDALHAAGVSDGAELVCFPQAGFGVLPLHAAWTPSAAGRRWISDRFAVRYAPSARCLVERQAAGKLNVLGNTVLVSNPPTPFKELTFAPLEMALVRAHEPLATTRELTGSEAGTTQVLAALADARLLHFATHGIFDVSDPFLSSLVLADGHLLSLDVLLPAIANSTVQHVVLSACETAIVSSWRRADEMIGFPAAFLEHGASTVLATLWPVDDLAAALLVGRFYSEWRAAPGTSAAQALRAAQNWLREATSDNLSDMLTTLVGSPDPLGGLVGDVRNRFYAMDPTDRPYAHPQYWAAFMISGL